MKRLILTRFWEAPDDGGTFGRIWYEDSPARWWFTLERPWRDNEASISCIPLGEYELRRGTFTANGTIDPYPDLEFVDVPGRSNIEIHAANFADELKGCIAPGKSFNTSLLMIGHSRRALAEMLAVVDGETDISILIRSA